MKNLKTVLVTAINSHNKQISKLAKAEDVICNYANLKIIDGETGELILAEVADVDDVITKVYVGDKFIDDYDCKYGDLNAYGSNNIEAIANYALTQFEGSKNIEVILESEAFYDYINYKQIKFPKKVFRTA